MLGGDTDVHKFQSTLPARGATILQPRAFSQPLISIHAPRTGSDGSRGTQRPRVSISIHAPRTGSDYAEITEIVRAEISIHAPRTGSDGEPPPWAALDLISIHAPRTGSDLRRRTPARRTRFQSTLPARGATITFQLRRWNQGHFNPRSPHGERLKNSGYMPCLIYFNPRSPHGERRARNALDRLIHGISIHAPRTGSDAPANVSGGDAQGFQSTLPARGATRIDGFNLRDADISIHAPRTGSDAGGVAGVATSVEISIHAPRTGSDYKWYRKHYSCSISIHAPRTGSDLRRLE